MISKLTALVLFLSSLSFAGTAIPTNTWVQVPTKGHAVQIVGWEPMRYSPTLKRMVMQGTFQSPSSEWNTALNAYDPLTNSWVVLELGSPHHSDYFWDQGHPSSGWGIDGGILHGWGGDSGSLTFENPFIGYSYDLVGQFGRRKQPVRAVPDNQQTSTVWHAAAKKWITWGGSSFTAMWLYDPATNTMEHRTTSTCSPACPDPSLFNSTMVYRPADQQVYLWGGLAAATSDELFKYDLATDTWTVVSVTGDKPTYPRHKHAMALDTAHDVILLMGGGNASDTPYTDTWTFDFATGAWTEQSPTAAYTGTLGPFQRMDYDPENNLFVCLIGGGPGAPYTDGTWTQYPTYTWFYRYSGTGSDVGSSSYIPVAPASGALNRNADGWANDTAIAGDGTDVITAWTETGAQYDASGPFTPHPQARKLNSGTWDWLGAAGGSIAEEGVSHPSLSNWISTTLIDSVPWISYSRAVYQELLPNVNAKYWDGNSWEGGEIGRVENISGASQSRTQIIGVGLVPWVAFLEIHREAPDTKLYVKAYETGAWGTKGSALNRTGTLSFADSVGIATDGTYPWVAWTEYVRSLTTGDGPGQVYVSRWDGSQWVAVGASLNVDTTNGWASDATIIYSNGQFYAAWNERSGVTGLSTVRVKTYMAGNWVSCGGSWNADTSTGWAQRPSLATDGTYLYATWAEQQDLGQRGKVHVARWSGSAVVPMGSAVSAASTGSVQRPALANGPDGMLLVWSEVNLGATRQTYTKKWGGTDWVQFDAIAPTITTSTLPTGSVATSYSQQISATGTPSTFTWSVLSGDLPDGLTLSSSGLLSGTPTSANTFVFTLSCTNGMDPSATQEYTVTISPTPPSVHISGGITIH